MLPLASGACTERFGSAREIRGVRFLREILNAPAEISSRGLISYPDLTMFYIGRGRSGYKITSGLALASHLAHLVVLLVRHAIFLNDSVRGEERVTKP